MDNDEKIEEMLSSPDLFVIGDTTRKYIAHKMALQIISPWSISDERSEELDALEYSDYLETLEWKEIRHFMREVFPRCSCCSATKELHVHHNCYPKRGTERPDDLTVLCKACHEKIHGIRNKRKKTV